MEQAQEDEEEGPMSDERKAPCGTITGATMRKDWRTPPAILDAVRRYYGGIISLDPATSADNHTAADHFCSDTPSAGHRGEWEGDDGLAIPWGDFDDVFVNPPYGRALREWLDKIKWEAKRNTQIIALLPCARWEQEYLTDMLAEADAVCFIRGRVSFINPDTGDAVSGNPYANMLVGFNVDEERFNEIFSPLSMNKSGGRSRCFKISPL